MPWRSSSTAPSPSASPGSGPACPGSGAGCGWTTAPTSARRGPRRTRGRPSAGRSAWHRRGRSRATTSISCTRAGPPGCPRASCGARTTSSPGSTPATSCACPRTGALEGVRKTIVGPGPLHLPACPLMHGTGGFTAMAAMTVGGCVVTLTNRRFDPVELLDTIDRENVNTVRDRGRRLRQAHPGAPSTTIPVGGGCPRCWPSCRPGSCGARRPSGACSTTTPT